MSRLDENFWTSRYLSGNTGWDVGEITTPIKEYIDQLTDKTLDILVPGAGNGYEVEYLIQEGFISVTVIDISNLPLERLRKNIPVTDSLKLIHGDFFAHQGKYDLILEQTFFCALNPSLRINYVEHMLSLLKPKGKLVGVLFDDPLFSDRPPFGGSITEYQKLFDGPFSINVLERCYNSIPARAGREAFISLIPAFSTKV